MSLSTTALMELAREVSDVGCPGISLLLLSSAVVLMINKNILLLLSSLR